MIAWVRRRWAWWAALADDYYVIACAVELDDRHGDASA